MKIIKMPTGTLLSYLWRIINGRDNYFSHLDGQQKVELLAPAVFVELSSLEKGSDPGTGELALRVRFEARIVIDSTIENAPIIVRSLASEVAKVVNKNTWNVENVSPGEFISAEVDGFRPELDAYLVWMVEWVHTIHVGRSIWKEGKFMPHKIEIGEINVRK